MDYIPTRIVFLGLLQSLDHPRKIPITFIARWLAHVALSRSAYLSNAQHAEERQQNQSLESDLDLGLQTQNCSWLACYVHRLAYFELVQLALPLLCGRHVPRLHFVHFLQPDHHSKAVQELHGLIIGAWRVFLGNCWYDGNYGLLERRYHLIEGR